MVKEQPCAAVVEVKAAARVRSDSEVRKKFIDFKSNTKKKAAHHHKQHGAAVI